MKPLSNFLPNPFTSRLRSLALLAALAAVCATGTAQTPESTGQAQQFSLANGFTLIVKPDRRAPTATHMLWLRVGSMDEVDGTSGVAHVLEHMLFKGSALLKPGEFSRRVAALGGRDNAFTSRDATGYHQQVPSDKLEDVMRLEADRFANNQWPDDEFKRELEVVKEERRLRTEESPRALMSEAANAVMFTASPYRRPVIGWMSDIEALTPQDARDFYRRWYVPANAAIVVVGDVDVAQVRRWADQYYGGIDAGLSAPRPVPERKPRAEPLQKGQRRMDFKAVASQAYVSLAFKVPQLQASDLAALDAPLSANGSDALALTVLAAVLDGYSGARLQRALEQGEQRVADSAGAYNGLQGRGPQIFALTAVPAEGKTTAQAAAALREQVALIAANGVSEAELKRVKTQWAASQTYKLDGVFSQAQELGSNWIQGYSVEASARLIARLRQVTSAQVQSVAARYFSDDQLTAATLIPQAGAPRPLVRSPALAN